MCLTGPEPRTEWPEMDPVSSDLLSVQQQGTSRRGLIKPKSAVVWRQPALNCKKMVNHFHLTRESSEKAACPTTLSALSPPKV